MRNKKRTSPPLPKREIAQHSVAMGRGLSLALIALSCLGLGLSVYLLFIHHRVRAEPGWQSPCAINATIDCDAVVLSRYSTVFRTPLAALGVWFYFMTGLVALVGLWRRMYVLPRSPAMCSFIAAVFAVALSIALAVISGIEIGALCIVCAGVYAVNAAMLILARRALLQTRETLTEAWLAEQRHWSQNRRHALKTSVGAVASFLLLLIAYSRSGSAAGSEICGAVADAAKNNLRVSLVTYADFQCPPCKKLDLSLRDIRSGLDIVHRHYPLDKLCNHRVKKTKYRGTCVQARAAICAAKQGSYDVVSDGLFDTGAAKAPDIVAMVVSLGLDRVLFEKCLGAPETTKELQTSIDAAGKDGVRAAPTIIINGRRHVGPLHRGDIACLATTLRSPSEH